jgi:hypothetical protein
MKISERYRELKKKWNQQAMTGETKDAENPIFIFSQTDTGLLQQIVKGKLDVTQLALLELEARHVGIRTYYAYNSLGQRVKCTVPE